MDDTNSSPYDNFTPAALADELFLKLSSKHECYNFEDNNGKPYLSIFRPYLSQAKCLIRRINVYDPPPEFEIKEKDIPAPLAEAILALGLLVMKQVITEVVCRLYESVDPDYFHINGIYGKVRWRFISE